MIVYCSGCDIALPEKDGYLVQKIDSKTNIIKQNLCFHRECYKKFFKVCDVCQINGFIIDMYGFKRVDKEHITIKSVGKEGFSDDGEILYAHYVCFENNSKNYE